MNRSLTCPLGFLPGADNVCQKLDVTVTGKNSRAGYRVWRILQPVVFFTIIERWFQQNNLSKNNSVSFFQKGSLIAGFDPTSWM
jgi:hypothetical protein